MWYAVKTLLTVGLVIAISELSKMSKPLAALLASLPLVSILAMIWMYVEGESVEALSAFSYDIFYLVLPSLILFLLLPALLHQGIGFYLSLFISCGVTAAAYIMMAGYIFPGS